MGNKFLVNREDLGKRVVGYMIYNDSNKDFMGMTEKQVKDSINRGIPIYGFILGEDGLLQVDEEGFHTTNYMVRTGIATLTPAFQHDGMINMFYIVVGSYKDDKNQTIYEVVSSRYGREVLLEQRLRVLLEIGGIQGGVYLDSKNKIVLFEKTTSIQDSKL